MCGRYTSTISVKEITERFNAKTIKGEVHPRRYNIAPSQLAPVIINQENEKLLTQFKWGLIPAWAKDPAIGNNMINARSETLSEKKTYKRLLEKRRCLVVADGFYEWVGKKPDRYPVRITLKDERLFSFAGLWDRWEDSDGNETKSFTIITSSTEGHEVMSPIHNRMPVILENNFEDVWLSGQKCELGQYLSNKMTYYKVSTLVNSPLNDSDQCITKLP